MVGFRFYPEVSFVAVASQITSLLLHTSSLTGSARAFWYIQSTISTFYLQKLDEFGNLQINHSKKLKIIFVAYDNKGSN